jgi:hypothetical protein
LKINEEGEPCNYSAYENYVMRIRYPSNWEKVDNLGDFGLSLETPSSEDYPHSDVYMNRYDLSPQHITPNQFSNASIQDIGHDANNFRILNSSKIALSSGNPAHQIIRIGNITGKEVVTIANR